MSEQLDSQTTSRASHWGITINNPTVEDRNALKQFPRFLRRVRGQDEIGENGTPHIQAYANTDQVRLSQMKTWLARAHFKPLTSKQHIDNMIAYVHKQDATAVPATQFDDKIRGANDSLTMAQMLTQMAEFAYTHSQIADKTTPTPNNMKPPNLKQVYEEEFWHITNMMLTINPDLIGLLSQPQYQRSWTNTRQVWINKFRAELDSQTDYSSTPPDSPISRPTFSLA